MDPVHFKNSEKAEKALTSTLVTPYGQGYKQVANQDDHSQTTNALQAPAHRPGVTYARIPDEDDRTLAGIGYEPVCGTDFLIDVTQKVTPDRN